MLIKINISKLLNLFHNFLSILPENWQIGAKGDLKLW